MGQDVPHIFGPRSSEPHDLALVADGLQEEQSPKEEGGMAFPEGPLGAKHLCMHFLV